MKKLFFLKLHILTCTTVFCKSKLNLNFLETYLKYQINYNILQNDKKRKICQAK